jgi:serine/threonine-protein kinase
MVQNEGLIGEKLGSFRIEAVLGSGAMGVVYRGTHEKTGKPAAIKVVSTEYAHGGKIRDRFDREAEILQQFRHPNIVRFLAVGRFRGTSYIAMEYIQGDTLDKIIQDRGPLPWREVVELSIQTCEALHYAHEHGVVHRDLKPSNLMISAEGKLKLTDFGIAKDLDATQLTGTGRTLGTAAYMAPEQIRGTPPVSHKTDLYALGVVLYQMLVGKAPFEGNTPVVLMHSHLNEPPPRPSAKVAEIPKKLDDLVVSLMAKSPTDRPWDAAAVGVKLTELRDKADKGAAVKMVWPAANPASSNPPRAVASSDTVAPAKKKSRKGGTAGASARSTQNRRAGSDADAPASWLNRSTIETGLLAGALLAIGGFIAYWVWPPSAEYLYKHAEVLMASSRRADRTTARDEYIAELDRRFPGHPYRDQTRKWLDDILLEDAEGRAEALASDAKIRLTRPDTAAERNFVIFNKLATDARERHDDLAAVRHWQKFGDQVKADDPDERMWHLLAQKRVRELEHDMQDRRQLVAKQIELANIADRAGRHVDAATIRTSLFKDYAAYTDLADIFETNKPEPDAAKPQEPSKPSAAEKGDPPQPPTHKEPTSGSGDPTSRAATELDVQKTQIAIRSGAGSRNDRLFR